MVDLQPLPCGPPHPHPPDQLLRMWARQHCGLRPQPAARPLQPVPEQLARAAAVRVPGPQGRGAARIVQPDCGRDAPRPAPGRVPVALPQPHPRGRRPHGDVQRDQHGRAIYDHGHQLEPRQHRPVAPRRSRHVRPLAYQPRHLVWPRPHCPLGARHVHRREPRLPRLDATVGAPHDVRRLTARHGRGLPAPDPPAQLLRGVLPRRPRQPAGGIGW
mmetsp:Transcript_43191/g.129636  ORF Transcript_43191/g.129636 Transcript_43191/m.129636 type:complete len:216 (+) Transcript_43191:2200-2847(+)